MGFLPFPAPLIVARSFLSYQLRAIRALDGSELWDGRYILCEAQGLLLSFHGWST